MFSDFSEDASMKLESCDHYHVTTTVERCVKQTDYKTMQTRWLPDYFVTLEDDMRMQVLYDERDRSNNHCQFLVM